MKLKYKLESPKNDLKSFIELFDRFKTLKKLVKKKGIIVDVGCNVGDTITEFQKNFACKKIYGFEPQKGCFELLKKRFNKKKNVELYDYALDKKIGKKYFFQHSYGDVYAGFYKINLKSKDHIDLKNRKKKKKILINTKKILMKE